jgi:hypothetical protein
MLIDLGDKLITTDLLEKHFVCDLSACKGACCVEGDAGAPLDEFEIDTLEDIVDDVIPYITEEGKAVIEEKGVFYLDVDGEPVTQLKSDGACVFVSYDADGTLKCGIEQAYNDKKVKFQKPISCALFPVRAKEYPSFTALNYEEIKICEPACSCGAKLEVPLFRFLKSPLIRAYGKDFFESLEEVDKEWKKAKSQNSSTR